MPITVQAGDTLAASAAGELEKGESCYVNFAKSVGYGYTLSCRVGNGRPVNY
jgi:hypothetical protein